MVSINTCKRSMISKIVCLFNPLISYANLPSKDLDDRLVLFPLWDIIIKSQELFGSSQILLRTTFRYEPDPSQVIS